MFAGCPTPSEALAVAQAVFASRYAGAAFAFAAGSIMRGEGTRLAADLLTDCKAAMGQVFGGYKGGDYVMGALTPLWVASYGTTGDKLMALHAGGELETAPNEW